MNIFRDKNGAVSIFLVIILVPCIVVSGLFVDVGRVFLAKGMSHSAADLALNTVMSNYDYDLNDYYGMMASCQNISDYYNVSAQYYLDTLISGDISKDEIDGVYEYGTSVLKKESISDLLQIECKTAPSQMISAVTGADMSNPAIIKEQIVEFMKYRAPIKLLSDTGILNSLKNVSKELEDSEKDNELIEKKQEFYEAENEFLEKAYNVYEDIQDYKALGVTQDKITQIQNRINSYESQYKEFHEALVKDLYNTDGLSEKRRREFNIDDAAYKSTTYKNNSDTDKKLATQSEIENLMDDLAAAITNFQNAKNNLEKNFPTGYSRGTGDGNTYDIQWWVKCNGISLDDFNNKAVDLLKAYNKLVNAHDFMDETMSAIFSDSTKTYKITGSSRDKYDGYNMGLSYDQHYQKLINQVTGGFGLYTKYLKSPLTSDESSADLYIKNMSILERITTNAANKQAINPAAHNLGTSGTNCNATISSIYSNITSDRKTLVESRDALKKVIDEVDDLSEKAENYKEALGEYDEKANVTDTEFGGIERKTIKDKKEKNYAKEVTKERVEELKTRLTNMKSVYDEMISAIDDMKYGSKKVKDISGYEEAKKAASISKSEIQLTNGELNSYAVSSFKFKKYHDADVNITINHSNNPDIDDKPVPELYKWMLQQGFDEVNDEEKKKAEKDYNDYKKQSKEKDEGEAPTTTASDILNTYSGSKAEFPSGFDMKAAGALDSLKGIANIAKSLFTDFDGAIVNMRDSLYSTEYVFGNFSYYTYEKEGKIELAGDMKKEGKLSNYDLNTISKKEAEELYKKLDDDWKNEALTFNYNKSLTNKMINSKNNLAYGCEIEYILYGKNNDENLSKAYKQIFTLRYLINLPAAFIHYYKKGDDSINIGNLITGIDIISTGISAATHGIIPKTLVEVVMLLIDAAVETKQEMEYLKAGLSVKFIKGDKNDGWVGFFGTEPRKIDRSKELCFDYGDYLYIFMITAFQNVDSAEAMYSRIGDVIQANMRTIIGEKGAGYQLSNSKVYFDFDSTLRVKPLMLALPIANDYSNNPKDRTDWCTFSYKMKRGYR